MTATSLIPTLTIPTSPIPNSTTTPVSSTRGCAVTRSRLSGWVLVRVVLLLTVQVLMVVALITDHTAPTTTTNRAPKTTAAQPQVARAAFTRPLTSIRPVASGGAPGARESRSGGSLSCAGPSRNRDGSANATGFSLNVVVSGNRTRSGPGSGSGPLVVTCGEQGRLMLLACSPLGGDSGRDPASWNQPPARRPGRAGWAPAAWNQRGWRGAWRRDWRDAGLSDEQLNLLNQLDPDQLRALLAQHHPASYPTTGDSGRSGYSGQVAGLSLGGMRISLGAPALLNQLPGTYSGASSYGDPYADPYGRSDAGTWSRPWSDSGYGPGDGAGYYPSSLDRLDSQAEADPVSLMSSHHHSDTDIADSGDSGRDGARGGWGAGGGAQRVGVCRLIGQR